MTAPRKVLGEIQPSTRHLVTLSATKASGARSGDAVTFASPRECLFTPLRALPARDVSNIISPDSDSENESPAAIRVREQVSEEHKGPETVKRALELTPSRPQGSPRTTDTTASQANQQLRGFDATNFLQFARRWRYSALLFLCVLLSFMIERSQWRTRTMVPSHDHDVESSNETVEAPSTDEASTGRASATFPPTFQPGLAMVLDVAAGNAGSVDLLFDLRGVPPVNARFSHLCVTVTGVAEEEDGLVAQTVQHVMECMEPKRLMLGWLVGHSHVKDRMPLPVDQVPRIRMANLPSGHYAVTGVVMDHRGRKHTNTIRLTPEDGHLFSSAGTLRLEVVA